jgi:hypothetical protein
MDGFSPEFSTYWLGEPVDSTERTGTDGLTSGEDLSASQQAALEELAGLVSAARSVV